LTDPVYIYIYTVLPRKSPRGLFNFGTLLGGFFEGGLSRGGAFKNFAPKGQNFLKTALEVCIFRPIFAVKIT